MELISIWFHYSGTQENQTSGIIRELIESVAAGDIHDQPDHFIYTGRDTGLERVELPPQEAVHRVINNRGSIKVQYRGLSVEFRCPDGESIDGSHVVKCFIPEVNFKTSKYDRDQIEANTLAVADLIETAHSVLNSFFAWGYLTPPLDGWEPVLETSRGRIEDGYVDALGWVTLFSPSAVDRYGHERLLSTLAWHIRELDDGSVLLVSAPSPVDFNEIEETAAAIASHLDLDVAKTALPGTR